MESNLPVMSKRVWSMVRVVYFMLRKNISKGKLMMGLNMILKRRGKIAGKAIGNLMFHHNHGGSTSSRRSHDSHNQFTASREYEFSCSNTPNNFFPIGKRHRHNHTHNNFFTCAQAPLTQDDDVATMSAMKVVLEMLNNESIVEASPALSGFECSPMMRQLRVTDSPFPLREDDEKDNQVDKAADDFIKRFYSQLRKQD